MMLLHLIDIDHQLTLLTFPNVTKTVCFMQIDSINRKFFMAVTTLLLLLHYSNNNTSTVFKSFCLQGFQSPPKRSNIFNMNRDRNRQSDGLTGWAYQEDSKKAPFPEAGLLKNKSTAALLPNLAKQPPSSHNISQPKPSSLAIKNHLLARQTKTDRLRAHPSSIPRDETVVSRIEGEKKRVERMTTEKIDEGGEQLWEHIINSKPQDLKKHSRGAQSQQLIVGKQHKRYLPLKLSNLNISNRIRAKQEHARNLIQMLDRESPLPAESLPQADPKPIFNAKNVREKVAEQLRSNFVKQGLPQMRKRRTDPPQKSIVSQDYQFSDSQMRVSVDKKEEVKAMHNRVYSIRVLPRLKLAAK